MFCPNCGKADQNVNSYCRQCGKFLPDFENPKKREVSPEEHFKANTILNVMSGVVSLMLAIWIFSFTFFKNAMPPPITIYITGGFLFAMFAWQVQVFIRNRHLKNQLLKKNRNVAETGEDKVLKTAETKRLLDEPNLNDYIPASVTEYTTKNLKEKRR